MHQRVDRPVKVCGAEIGVGGEAPLRHRAARERGGSESTVPPQRWKSKRSPGSTSARELGGRRRSRSCIDAVHARGICSHEIWGSWARPVTSGQPASAISATTSAASAARPGAGRPVTGSRRQASAAAAPARHATPRATSGPAL